jgi:DNA-binding transcriptional ArsR family regulator
MREFFVYGFKSRDEFGSKSARSYDNERRRIESWLSDHMSFRQDASGKNVFISVDTCVVSRNPLYQAWKAKSFTKNDITLHFWLLVVLSPSEPKSLADILDAFDESYLPLFPDAEPIDESTLRKKLKEYVELGLIIAEKQGKQLVYKLSEDNINLQSWADAVTFFAEIDPLGVIGSYIQDKFDALPDYFRFKHNYLLFAPDSGVMLDLLLAINEHRRAELEFIGNKRHIVLPLKIFVSTQGGRQYVAASTMRTRRIMFFRLDSIQKVKPLDAVRAYDTYASLFENCRAHLWGVAGGDEHLEHIEMTLSIEADERHIVHRLEREKRCGNVEQLDDQRLRFTADVFDAQEMLPWLRTFIGRIETLSCSSSAVKARFEADISAMAALYAGGDGDAV